jgi:hypothetical protein
VPAGLDAACDIDEDARMTESTVAVTITLPTALAERIDAFNATMGWDRQTFLRLAARAYLSAREADTHEPPPGARSPPREDRP